MTAPIAARLFAFATTITVLFQVALALGAPWGHLAMGGRSRGKLPPALRVAALAQAGMLALLAVIIATRARLTLARFYPFSETAAWIAVAVSVLSLIMNLITPSRGERLVWTPVTLVLVFSSLIVALS